MSESELWDASGNRNQQLLLPSQEDQGGRTSQREGRNVGSNKETSTNPTPKMLVSFHSRCGLILKMELEDTGPELESYPIPGEVEQRSGEVPRPSPQCS